MQQTASASPRFLALRARLARAGHRAARITGSTWNWRVATAILIAAIVTGVETTDANAFPVVNAVEEMATGVVEGVAKTVEQRVEAGVSRNRGNQRHLGFDTNRYPGDRSMQRWKDVEHYTWVGYYIPAPCHKDASWSGKRATLERQGWGMAVIYVGQQYWGPGGHVAGPVRRPAARRVARPAARRAARRATRAAPKRAAPRRAPARTSTKKRARRAGVSVALPVPSARALSYVLLQVRPAALTLPQANHAWDCKSELLSASQGRREGLDAIARTEAEGFPRGTAIYLDIERMEKVPQGMRDYYRAWTQAVLADGRFVPAYYAHNHNARQIFDDVAPLFAAAKVTEAPRFWIASGRNFNKGKAPTDVGHEFAAIWQGVLDITEVWGGVRLPIDINVSDNPNPSAPAD